MKTMYCATAVEYLDHIRLVIPIKHAFFMQDEQYNTVVHNLHSNVSPPKTLFYHAIIILCNRKRRVILKCIVFMAILRRNSYMYSAARVV